MDPADTRSSFLRQRRNLMAISVVNLFVTLSGIKLNELDVLGNKFTIQNPRYITASLWIAFLYWLVRYFQLLHDTGNLGIRDKYVTMVFRPTALVIQPQFEEYVRAEMRSRKVPESESFWLENMNWKTQPSMLWPFGTRVFTMAANYNLQDTRGGLIHTKIAADWELRPHYGMFLKSWFDGLWYVLAKSSLGTEYILPPLLAFGV